MGKSSIRYHHVIPFVAVLCIWMNMVRSIIIIDNDDEVKYLSSYQNEMEMVGLSGGIQWHVVYILS